jgi:hypothetical protein
VNGAGDLDELWFVDLALDNMVSILRELGDVGANKRPEFPGANTPYAIVTHCLGVMEFWGGASIAGRPITRDREAEFRASGEVEPLIARVEVARRQLADDVAGMDASAPPEIERAEKDAGRPYAERKGAVLLHVVEELFQHLGHLEITRDLVADVPIACSLDADGWTERIDEWRSFVREGVTGMVRAPGVIRLPLRSDEPDVVTRALSLARREKECCPFFAFALADGVLRVTVAAGAEEALQSFGQLLAGDSD